MPNVDAIWRGETVACIATGPSLTAEDCEYVRGRARIIAINDAHRLAPFADAVYSSDRMWWRKYKGLPLFTGPKYGIGSAPGKANAFHDMPQITVLKNTGPLGFEKSPDGLKHGDHSGYACINLAVHLGAKRIILLGYDMGSRNGKLHFFGNHQGLQNPTDALMAGRRKHYYHLLAPLAAIGVEVINCTPGSSVDAFPMADLRDVLSTPLEVAC